MIRNKVIKLVVGLCGRSGSGKSVICAELEKKGAYIIDADLVARQIMTDEVIAEINSAFPGSVSHGALDRQKLASLVFSDERKLEILNSITHPRIRKAVLDRINSSSCEYIVVDAPVLIEAHMKDMFDCTACIVSPDSLRIKRIIARDGLSFNAAMSRLSAQNTDEFYINNTDFYIVNDGSRTPVSLADEFIERSRAVVFKDK